MAHCALHQGCTRDARSHQLRMEIHKVSHRSFHLWYMSLWGGVGGGEIEERRVNHWIS